MGVAVRKRANRCVPPTAPKEAAMWYAVQVWTGKERVTLEQICKAVELAGLEGVVREAFVPTRVVFEGQLAHARRVERPLFPGYLLLDATRRGIAQVARVVRETPKFAKVLTYDGVFLPLLPEETDLICALTQRGRRSIDVSEGFVEGGRVVVVAGPLVGQESTIKKVNRRKRAALVELSICGRRVEVELGLELMKRNRERVQMPASA